MEHDMPAAYSIQGPEELRVLHCSNILIRGRFSVDKVVEKAPIIRVSVAISQLQMFGINLVQHFLAPKHYVRLFAGLWYHFHIGIHKWGVHEIYIICLQLGPCHSFSRMQENLLRQKQMLLRPIPRYGLLLARKKDFGNFFCMRQNLI